MQVSRFCILLCLVLILVYPGISIATDVFGDVWGTWTLENSPYYLIDDARVPPDSTLVIEPGVEVIGMGNFKLTVDSEALLTAVGNQSQRILFSANDHVIGWRGIRLEDASDDTQISFCLLEYARGTGAYPEVRGGALNVRNCSPLISYNLFRFSSSMNENRNGTGGGISTEYSSAQILNNVVFDNEADSGGGICVMEYGSPFIDYSAH